MSSFVCDDATITCIARSFVDYGVEFKGGKPKDVMDMILIDVNKETKRIGQALLDENYRSVNCRYNEETETPEFKAVELLNGYDEGTVLGCIQCYEYQACDSKDWEETEVYRDLQRMKEHIVDQLLRKLGMEKPYGYGSFDTLE